MRTILKGQVFQGLKHTSRSRFLECKAIFEKRGIVFPPFFLGTVNVRLEIPFDPPKGDYIRLHVPQSEMVGQPESWDLIRVSHINGIPGLAYIYRTSTNYWGNDVVELIAYDLGGSAQDGKSITMELPHST